MEVGRWQENRERSYLQQEKLVVCVTDARNVCRYHAPLLRDIGSLELDVKWTDSSLFTFFVVRRGGITLVLEREFSTGFGDYYRCQFFIRK